MCSGTSFFGGYLSSSALQGSTSISERPEAVADAGAAAVRRVLRARHAFDVLELPAAWTDDCGSELLVRSRYRQASLRVHPDKNGAKGAAEAFRRVHRALQTLLDPARRRRALQRAGAAAPSKGAEERARKGAEERVQHAKERGPRFTLRPRRRRREPTAEEVLAAFQEEEARFLQEMAARQSRKARRREPSPPLPMEQPEMAAEEQECFDGRVSSWLAFRRGARADARQECSEGVAAGAPATAPRAAGGAASPGPSLPPPAPPMPHLDDVGEELCTSGSAHRRGSDVYLYASSKTSANR